MLFNRKTFSQFDGAMLAVLAGAVGFALAGAPAHAQSAFNNNFAAVQVSPSIGNFTANPAPSTGNFSATVPGGTSVNNPAAPGGSVNDDNPPRLSRGDLRDIIGPAGSGNDGRDVTDVTTDKIVAEIGYIRELCSWFPPEVRIDCMADRFRALAKSLPRQGEYAPVRDALLTAADKLNRVSQEFAADGVRPKRHRAPDPDGVGEITTARLQEVRRSALTAANEAAAQVITEMQTVLLRSAENSRKRMVHYQEISAALGSTKVLLRSA